LNARDRGEEVTRGVIDGEHSVIFAGGESPARAVGGDVQLMK
jgi:ornithine carbamoyltransferase